MTEINLDDYDDPCVAVRRTDSGALEIEALTADTIQDWHQVQTHHEADGVLDSLLLGWEPWTALYRVVDADTGDEHLYARSLSDPALLRAVRFRLGLTQTQLAERLGVSLRSVQYWEVHGLPDERTRLALRALVDEVG